MLWEFFRFEVASRLRQPTVWVFSAVFALAAFATVSSDAVAVGGGGGSTAIDAPLVIAQVMSIFSIIGVVVVTAFVATAVIRDYEQRTYSLFFTTPIRKRALVLGRYFGSLLAAQLVLVGAAIGIAIGTMMPWLDPERLVGTGLGAYAWTLGVLVGPNLFVMGAIFFAIGTLTRRVLYAYVGVAGFFVLYVVSQGLISGLDNDTLAALADPFGLTAIAVDTRYWTIAERNSQMPQLLPDSGALLVMNRVLWASLGAVALAYTVVRFRMAAPLESGRNAALLDADAPAPHGELPQTTGAVGPRVAFAQLVHQTKVECSGIFRSTAYVVIALFAALNSFGGIWGSIDEMFGTPVYPVTAMMVDILEGSLSLFVLIVIVFYAGELAWKERRLGLGAVYDALPLATWVRVVAKLLALWTAIAGLLVIGVLVAILMQIGTGGVEVELGLYGKSVFLLQGTRWMLVATLAIVLQGYANHKYVGFLCMAGYFVVDSVMRLVDLERGLYRFAASPAAPYSEMNGYGHFITAVFWYRVYWALGAALLLGLAILVWPRGTDTRVRLRLRRARAAVRGNIAIALLACASAFAATGAYIFYNTSVVGTFVPSDEAERLRVVYEQRYAQYLGLPQPRVTAADIDVALFPQQRRADVRGQLVLVNRTTAPIDSLHVTVNQALDLRKIEIPGASLQHDDDEVGYRIYAIDPPMPPGGELRLEFDVGFDEPGFREQGSSTAIVHNGSFLHSPDFVPRIGYDRGAELTDPNERRKRGLPERARMADLDDPKAVADSYISHEADWIEFAATVSTDVDQIALAPGYLQREWTENGRRYFRYVMDAPILDFYAFLSARWTVQRDQWNDVAIEVYHHPSHDANVARMIEATKQSLDYFTSNFSPYQHRQVRIVEFPGYQSFAQSFPNTIPYSESIGFIADLRDPEDIDYVFYVTAHEVAHQWWAHQVIGAAAQGSTVLSETLSQYSALMVMEKAYGREHMRKFLAFELDRYLGGRGREIQRELPLMRVEDQPYIHYNKGSLVMYALREYIGEATVNGVLSQYLADVGFSGPPYPTARGLVDRFRAVTPADRAYLIEDLFETITLYDNRAHAARARKRPDGQWDIELDVETKKLRAADDGSESEVPMNDLVEVGVLVEREGEPEPVPTALRMERFVAGTSTITITSPELPVRAAIDPRALLVDRSPSDNARKIEVVD
jgi:ABC-type transport system involved in multi-copper enzyme maturation permease subunit